MVRKETMKALLCHVTEFGLHPIRAGEALERFKSIKHDLLKFKDDQVCILGRLLCLD